MIFRFAVNIISALEERKTSLQTDDAPPASESLGGNGYYALRGQNTAQHITLLFYDLCLTLQQKHLILSFICLFIFVAFELKLGC